MENPPESLRLFSICEAMKWSHLPVAGGIYDQHPALLDQWYYIMARRAAIEAVKRAQEESKKASKHKVSGMY